VLSRGQSFRLEAEARTNVKADANVTRPTPNFGLQAEAKANILVSRPGEAKDLASRPDEAKMLASRPNESVNHVSLVFVLHRKLAFKRVGLNNLRLLTRPVAMLV